MNKKELIKLLEKLDDDVNIVVNSTTKFKEYSVISEEIELIEDEAFGEKIVILQEKR